MTGISDDQVMADDIMVSAEKALDNVLCNCVESCGGYDGLRKASIMEIAKVLFAERERCASIAGYYAQACLETESDGSGYYACSALIDEIRNPKPSTPPMPRIDDADLPF